MPNYFKKRKNLGEGRKPCLTVPNKEKELKINLLSLKVVRHTTHFIRHRKAQLGTLGTLGTIFCPAKPIFSKKSNS